MPKRVAVVGAGASGLAAIKTCLEDGLTPVCFESSDDIGGLWNFHDTPEDGRACVMQTTVSNISKELMCYSDFPFPDDFPNYCHNSKILEYYRLYTREFLLLPHIRFLNRVVSVKKRDDFLTSGQWTVTAQNLVTGEVSEGVFDAVMLCAGHETRKHIPDFPGLETFKGKIMHSHDYRSMEGFQGKTVIIIGIGNSAGDLAADLSKVAKHVYISTRRGFWMMNRKGAGGLPIDLEAQRRVIQLVKRVIGWRMTSNIVEKRLNGAFDHKLYGCQPQHSFLSQSVLMNDELPNRLMSGLVSIKPQVQRFGQDSVEFEDGSTIHADVVIFATGYDFSFPFLDPTVMEVSNNKVRLYKYVFIPDLKPNTLAAIGYIRASGSPITISELQCRWACQLFKGAAHLPSEERMKADIVRREEAMRQWTCSPRDTLRVDWMSFMDEIAAEFDARPRLAHLFWRDPSLALRCFFGPLTSYQYRLYGPGKWAGARVAIMSQTDRIYKGCHPNSTPPKRNLLRSTLTSILAVAFGAFLAHMIRLKVDCVSLLDRL